MTPTGIRVEAYRLLLVWVCVCVMAMLVMVLESSYRKGTNISNYWCFPDAFTDSGLSLCVASCSIFKSISAMVLDGVLALRADQSLFQFQYHNAKGSLYLLTTVLVPARVINYLDLFRFSILDPEPLLDPPPIPSSC